MRYLIKIILKPIYLYIFNSKFRLFCFLVSKYGNSERYKNHKDISFLKFKVDVVDLPSFVWQYKEIFYEEIYKFNINDLNGTIVDCGSNIGLSLIYFSTNFPKTKIIAFEADKVISEICKNNLFKNKIKNVTLHNAAVWINNDGINFNSDGADGGLISFDENNDKCKSVRLRDILEKENNIELLKIDIEGAELEVLIDCKNSLEKVKNIFVEFHSKKNIPQSLSALLNILEKNNFKYYIEDVSKKKYPFYFKETDGLFDLQLNIYATKKY